ncbi:MAG: hemolysin family protein [Bacteroidota bacterium]|nr:hemolysin family protein [Bacteroidota bacterium]
MDWTSIIAIAASLILIGFFAGIEIAFVSVSKLSVELKRKQGSYTGRIWSAFMEAPTRFIGTTLIALNILLVVYGLLWSQILDSVWKYWRIEDTYIKLAFETIISTFLLLIFEFIFKAFFRAKGNAIISSGIITFIVQFFYSLFAWLATFFVNVTEWMLKYIFNVKLQNKTEVFTKIDLEHFIQQHKQHDMEDNEEMNNELFENVLSLSDIKIRECLIPRKEIEAIDINSPINFVKTKFIDSKLSKLVVYEGNIDNIQGYIHQLDLFKHPSELRDILLPIPAIPESMNATDLINKFSRERKSIAWVVDEFGGTAGIVTMEDLLEEIFGDIKDEYDLTEEFVDKQISANEYLFSGRLELDYLIDKYKFDFRHDGDTGTLSGYIINQHESIPRQKDRIIVDDYQFDVLSVSDTRIETVKLKVLR